MSNPNKLFVFTDLAEKVKLINIETMTDMEICRWFRSETSGVSLKDSLRIAKMIRAIYEMKKN